MYRIEAFALSCRAINAATLGDMIYVPLTSLIAKVYSSYGAMQSCRDTVAVTKLIRRITRQWILYSTWPRPICYTVNYRINYHVCGQLPRPCYKDEKLMKRL